MLKEYKLLPPGQERKDRKAHALQMELRRLIIFRNIKRSWKNV